MLLNRVSREDIKGKELLKFREKLYLTDHGFREQMFAEIRRVLKVGGRMILITPFYFWAHEEPHDYFRVSKYGLLHLCEINNLKLLEIEHTCGVISTYGLLITIALTRLFYKFPVLLKFMLRISQVVQKTILLWFDDRIDRSKRFAQGHLIVASKDCD